MTFKNMKFKVDSPEQSERLQKVLFGLGYAWQCCDASVLHTNAEILFVDDTSRLTYIPRDYDGYFNRHYAEEQNTEAFLAAHEFSLADVIDQVFLKPDMEPINHPDGFWFDNTGTMPELPDGTKVDVVFKDGGEDFNGDFKDWDWSFEDGYCPVDIAKWRFHRSEKPEEYFVQPKTKPKARCKGVTILDKDGKIVSTTKQIDSHYNYSYTLTEADKLAGTIKIDPYFVSQQWKLGSKDDSGVIWHIFKTCARFGMKNDKAREITAIYKSIQRLAQLEGVELK